MRKFIPKPYLELFANRNFFKLSVVTFVGQTASGFLLLSLIISAFSKTHSNFGVSGAVLSFTVPGFLLMAFAGVMADIFDRRKIIIIANSAIAAVVFLILIFTNHVFAFISLSFLYFAGNTFFYPAASAASSQLVAKSRLVASNAVFILNLGAGLIVGVFLGSIVNLFFGNFATLIVCDVLLFAAVVLSLTLPKLAPKRKKVFLFFGTTRDVALSYKYIFRQRRIWFSFMVYASIQALVSFGVTLTPGFYDQVVGLPVEKSPLFFLPLVGFGVFLGSLVVHRLNLDETKCIALGISCVGISSLALGLVIFLQIAAGLFLLIPLSITMILFGFGAMISVTEARAGIQRKVLHHYQGSVFGANIMFTSFMASILSPAAALLESIFGYVNILVFGGLGLALVSASIFWVGRKWKF